MTNTFEPKKSILPPAQQALWRDLAPLAQQGFVLYGGTAIALRLEHRQSVDFDFFTSDSLDYSRLKRSVSFLKDATPLQWEEETLSVLIQAPDHTEVKVSLFGQIDFGRVGTPAWTSDHVLLVASLEDLLATKLKVIFERAQAKDYQDIAAILRHGHSLAHGLAAAQAMFGRDFQPAICLKALTYFSEGDLDELNERDRQTLIEAVGQVRDLPEVNHRSKRLI